MTVPDTRAGLAPGSTVAMTFLLPPELLDEADRPGLTKVRTGAKASGTPFVSLYSPREMLEMAKETGLTDIRHVPGTALSERYFAGRPGGEHRLPHGGARAPARAGPGRLTR